jgi:hypothetical protein
MSDPKSPDAPAQDTIATPLRTAKPGVRDKGEVVGSAGGEPISGHIADLADGDE